MKRLGFTLVELLVVIAIIALLISILAPSLKTAKDLTRQMLCMTNMKSLGMSLVMYAEGNSGKMMPGYNCPTNDGTPSNPDGLCLAFTSASTGLAEDGYLASRHTIGWAYAKGVWTSVSLLYCPLLATQGTGPGYADYRRYPQPWGTKLPDATSNVGSAHIRITYMYYPHIKSRETGWMYGLQLASFPPDKPTVCDAFYNQGFCGHTLSGTQWFMTYSDGHVGFRTSERVLALYRAGINAYGGPYWPEYQRVYEALFE